MYSPVWIVSSAQSNEFCKIAGNQQTIFSFLSRPNLQFCRSLSRKAEKEG
jgi:hypothetical protein